MHFLETGSRRKHWYDNTNTEDDLQIIKGREKAFVLFRGVSDIIMDCGSADQEGKMMTMTK